MKKRLFTAIVALAAMVSGINAQTPKREMRSTWLATVWAIDWPASHNATDAKKQMDNYLDGLAADNFTGVCFQVRSMADAMYKSSYEPWSSALTGTRGKDPGWDPLAYVVEACHSRGLECYAWVNPYRESSSANIQNSDIDRKWEADGWLMSNGSYIVFNPAMPEVRAHILNVIKEIYTNYAIDGLLFDDYFYPSGGTSEKANEAPDWQLYKDSGTLLSIGDWRRKNINDFMHEIYENIQEDRPDMRFGLSPAGVSTKSAERYGLKTPAITASDWQYSQIYSDPLAWMAEKSIDFISPQLYWLTTHSTAPFGPLTDWWSYAAAHFGCHFYASHSISLLADANTRENWADIAKQVTLHRQSQTANGGEPGNIYYSTKYINGNGAGGGVKGLGDYLKSDVYAAHSLVPRITWKERPVYNAPADATIDGTTLSWTAAKPARDNSIIRYTVYSIPTTLSINDAMSADGDGIDIAYLENVTYDTKYTITNMTDEERYYAICVYDGYGYESEPALVGYATEPSAVAVLTAPADEAYVEWETEFSWEEVPDATYRIQISQAADFSKPGIVVNNIKTNSCTVDLNALKGSTTYYWRVVTAQKDKLPAVSASRSFITPERLVGNYENGYTVVKDADTYADAASYSIESLWIRSVKDGYNNFNIDDNGALNRGMVATDDYVYISGRTAPSATADIYLQVYDAATGEFIGRLPLSASGQCSYLPCNDLLKDSAGNILISNLVLDASTTPIKIFMVNTDNGDLSLVASVEAKSKMRIDHAGVYGDVTTGNFTVFAAAASGTNILRWKFTDGQPGNCESVTATEFCPKSASHFGIAPRVLPVSEDLLYIDGGSTAVALYDFKTGKIVDCPESGVSHYPSHTDANGMDLVTLGDNTLMVYSASAHQKGYSFHIVEHGKNMLSDATHLWTVPASTMGNVNSTTSSAPVSVIANNDSRATVYTYAPGNGIAAYAITSGKDKIVDVAVEAPRFRIYGNVAVFDKPCDFIRVYNLSGVLVAASASATEIALPGNGTYIVVTPFSATKVAVK